MKTFPQLQLKHQQRGFLLPMSAFIVVSASALAIAIANMAGQANDASVREGLSVQAFYAAESAAGFAMNQLFFSATDRAAVDVNCSAVSGDTINFSSTGLASCSSSITCTRTTDGGDTLSFYIIESNARCGAGELIAERTVAVSTKME